MISASAIGDLLTTVDTSRKRPLGTKVCVEAQNSGDDANQGEQIWVYVFNDEATDAFAAGEVVVRDPSVTTHKMYGGIRAAAATVYHRAFVIGVAQHTIAAGSYGWILVKGKGLLMPGSADITADVGITTGGDNAGSVIDWADGVTTPEAIIGHSLEAEDADDTPFDAFIDCAG